MTGRRATMDTKQPLQQIGEENSIRGIELQHTTDSKWVKIFRNGQKRRQNTSGRL